MAEAVKRYFHVTHTHKGRDKMPAVDMLLCYDRSFMRPRARGEHVEVKIWRQQRDAGFASALCRARGFKGKHKDLS